MNDEFWDDNEQPIAFLITFRTFGTWLHGDERRSVDRHREKNIYGTPSIEPNQDLNRLMQENQTADEFVLDGRCRAVVEKAVLGVCELRKYLLYATNVRTNHVHSVVYGSAKPESIMNAFKPNATRELRQAGLVGDSQKVWSRGGSTRYLWRQSHLDGAVDYVLYGQGDDLPNF
jgi:REP element-mobilizing transposase RayT